MKEKKVRRLEPKAQTLSVNIWLNAINATKLKTKKEKKNPQVLLYQAPTLA